MNPSDRLAVWIVASCSLLIILVGAALLGIRWKTPNLSMQRTCLVILPLVTIVCMPLALWLAPAIQQRLRGDVSTWLLIDNVALLLALGALFLQSRMHNSANGR